MSALEEYRWWSQLNGHSTQQREVIDKANRAIAELTSECGVRANEASGFRTRIAELEAENERLLDDAAEFLSLLCPEGRPARGWHPSDGVIIPNVEAKKMWRGHLKKRAEREKP